MFSLHAWNFAHGERQNARNIILKKQESLTHHWIIQELQIIFILNAFQKRKNCLNEIIICFHLYFWLYMVRKGTRDYNQFTSFWYVITYNYHIFKYWIDKVHSHQILIHFWWTKSTFIAIGSYINYNAEAQRDSFPHFTLRIG